MSRFFENHPILKAAIILLLKSVAILIGMVLAIAGIAWVFGDLVQGRVWQALLIAAVISCLTLWFLVGRQMPIEFSFRQVMSSIATGLSLILTWTLYQFWLFFYSGAESCAGGTIAAGILGFIAVCGGGTMMTLGYVFRAK